MKRHLPLILITLLGLQAPSQAEDTLPKPGVKGEVLEFGLFEPVGQQTITPDSHALSGKALHSPGVHFTKQTTQVPATLGVLFGFSFNLTGVTEQGSAEYKKVITHPPIRNAKGEIEREYSTTITRPTNNGYLYSVCGYRLNRPEELVPGVWTFEIWYHDKTIVSQSFTVLGPDGSSTKTPAK